MLNVKSGEQRFVRAKDLWRAKSVVLYFIKDAIRHNYATMMVVVMLAILVLTAQALFLFLLVGLVNRLTGKALVDSAVGQQFGTNAPDFLTHLEWASDIALALMTVGCLFAISIMVFISQYVTTTLNNEVFKRTMRKVTSKLVRMRETGVVSTLIEPGSLVVLYTKGCRYAGMMVSKSLRVIQPVVSSPFLAVFCFYYSPILSVITLGVVIVSLPIHLMIMRRGLIATRGLLDGAMEHRRSKESLIHAILSFPQQVGFEVESLNQTYVDKGSDQYLKYYHQRRLLASFSQFTSAITVGVIVLVILSALLIPSVASDLRLDLAIAFVVALRFLSTSVGQIVAYLTTALSITPLVEATHNLLISDPSTTAYSKAPQKHIAKLLEDSTAPVVPQTIVLSGIRINPSIVALFNNSGKIEKNWKKAMRGSVLVSANYPALFKDLRSNLFLADVLDLRVALADSMPQDVIGEIYELLQTEQKTGFTPKLWKSVSGRVRVYATLHSAMTRPGDTIFMSGNIRELLGVQTWTDIEERIAASGRRSIQFMESIPKRPRIFPEQSIFMFDGERLERVSNKDGAVPSVAQLNEAIQSARERSDRRRSSDIAVLEDDEEEGFALAE